MNLEIRGIRYNISDATKEFFDKKLQKLSFAESLIHNLTITVTRETVGQGFKLDAKVHFGWGLVKMVSTDCYELYEGIEVLVDKLEALVRKEKGKIQDH
ncbi:MAG: ribosome-associated translation inhibitor RaiA [Sphaerochaetaceae bacterium]|nr:ribosome-associated translation inhibitor RaiA [Candidatus Cloacimonadota bacterium]